MDIKLLSEKFAAATDLSVSIYSGALPANHYNEQTFSRQIALQLMEPYFDSDYNVSLLITQDYLQFGYVRSVSTGEIILIGPAVPYEFTPRQAENFRQNMKISRSRNVDIMSWFHHLPVFDMKKFRNLLDLLNYIVNGTSEEPVRMSCHAPLINTELKSDDLAYIDIFTRNVEDTMLAYIEHGRTSEMEHIFDGITDLGSLPNIGSDNLSSLQNTFVASTAIASRAAVKGGLDYDTALSLSNYYISGMDKLGLFSDIVLLLRTMLLDYTRRVAEIQSIRTDSATVSAVCKFINSNLYRKISVKDIAEELDLNVSYLSHHFREKTGQTLSGYIRAQKIKEAKFLLRTTSLPLSEISEHLAFSSQQYFQTTFHKDAGMTPQQYRLQNQVHSR